RPPAAAAWAGGARAGPARCRAPGRCGCSRRAARHWRSRWRRCGVACADTTGPQAPYAPRPWRISPAFPRAFLLVELRARVLDAHGPYPALCLRRRPLVRVAGYAYSLDDRAAAGDGTGLCGRRAHRELD